MKEILIATAANDDYIPYMAVMMRSVIDHMNDKTFIRFVVLHKSISKKNIELVKKMLNKLNAMVDFIDVSDITNDYCGLYVSNHIKIETYFRLLLPDLVPERKLIYLDCDIIANADISELWQIELGDNLLLGTRDADSAANYNTDKDYKKYIDRIVGLEKPYDYVQAGVLVMNLALFRRICPTSLMLKTALSRKWRFHDQDTLNHLCKGRIEFIDYEWDFVYDYNDNYRRSTEVIKKAPAEIEKDYLRAKENPKIVHYSWIEKPWHTPLIHLGEKFWMTARDTPFYVELLHRMSIHISDRV